MKKFLALAGAAVIYVILFAGIPIGGFLILLLTHIDVSQAAYLALGIFILAAVAFGLAALINRIKRIFTDRLEFLPLTYYISVFLPSIGISAVYFGVVIQRINSGYYSDSFAGDWDKGMDLAVTAAYFFFTAVTAILAFILHFYRKKKDKLNRQVEEYIHEHES